MEFRLTKMFGACLAIRQQVKTPEQLLQEARAGDGAPLGRLIELYRRYLTLLARVQIGQRHQGIFSR